MRTVIVLLLLVLAPAVAGDSAAQLPPPERWLDHLTRELLPFWDQPSALGNPIGSFPTNRCNDGTVLDIRRPCAEFRPHSWLLVDRQWVVPLSRQIYGYGVAFHMTGDPKYLDYARAGVDYLRNNAMDRVNGGVASYYDGATRRWMPQVEFRNPQELAYALLGMGFYYYLTRDPEVLPDIIAVKDHILTSYWNPGLGVLQWYLRDQPNDPAAQRRIVAVLDQMNAYMALLAPILPEPYRTTWKTDLVGLSNMLIGHFWSDEIGLFYTSATTAADKDPAKATVDYGHSIKAMWMIRWAGRLFPDPFLVEFAESLGPNVLDQAWLDDTGSWANARTPAGVNKNKDWWIYAELDQFSATMALKDPKFAGRLVRSYDYWFNYFVDPVYGEVWNTVDAATNKPVANGLPKQWTWKNAYHSLEHALVAYITTSQLHARPVTLYYAFIEHPPSPDVRPYFFDGELQTLDYVDAGGGRMIHKAVFKDIR
jgi:mannose/cellobiose epimerase-like protein (N-acyl-D-glucosamine 2-epimerase family)